jgi:dolichol-phosphate mannosyltransferase
LIVPVYNEEEAVVAFHAQLREAIDPLFYSFTITYVNDGSTDGTARALQEIASQDERVVVVELSRNFGHQAALTAGLDLAEGEYVITMDGDGQHPPALLGEMLRLAESGYDVVLAQRIEAEQADNRLSFKRWSSDLFYRLINRIGDTRILPGAADFRLLSRPVVLALRQMREYHRLLRGMVAWMGYRTVILPYKQPEAGRAHKYRYARCWPAMNTIFFSLVPHIGISVGLVPGAGAGEMVCVLSFWVVIGREPGLRQVELMMFVLLVVGGSLMVTIGFGWHLLATSSRK